MPAAGIAGLDQGGAGRAPRRAAADAALRRAAPGAGGDPVPAAGHAPSRGTGPAAPGGGQRVRVRRDQRPRRAGTGARRRAARRSWSREPERVLRLAAADAERAARAARPATRPAAVACATRRGPTGSAIVDPTRETARAGPQGGRRGQAVARPQRRVVRRPARCSARRRQGRVRLPRPGGGVRRRRAATWPADSACRGSTSDVDGRRRRPARRGGVRAGPAARRGAAPAGHHAGRRRRAQPGRVDGDGRAGGCTPPTRSTPSSPAFDPDALRRARRWRSPCSARPPTRCSRSWPAAPDVVLSHDNAPNQSMICGPRTPVDALVAARCGRDGVIGAGAAVPVRLPHADAARPTSGRSATRPSASRCTRRPLPVWSATTAAPYPADRGSGARAVRAAPARAGAVPAAGPGDARRRVPRVRPVSAPGSSARWSTTPCAAATTSSWRRTRRTGPASRSCAGSRPRCGWTAPAPDLACAAAGRPRGAATAVKLDLGGAPVSLDEQVRAQDRACRAVDRAELSTVDSLAGAGARSRRSSPRCCRTPPSCASDRAGAAAGRSRPRRRRSWTPQLTRVARGRCRTCSTTASSGSAPLADPADRWPVVPATTVIDHLMGVRRAGRARPPRGRRARRPAASSGSPRSPPVDVPVQRPAARAADRVLGRPSTGYARGRRRTRAGLPGRAAAPGGSRPRAERVPETTAAQLYTERWMFHGPRFQGVTELTAIGDRHVRGVLTTPAAPGALLDNVGQLLGYWIMRGCAERTTVFPVAHGARSAFHGPHPAPGRAAGVPGPDHRADRRDRSTPTCSWSTTDRSGPSSPAGGPPVRQRPRASASADRDSRARARCRTSQPGGWALVHERWPDLATRELIMRNYLGGAERDDVRRPSAARAGGSGCSAGSRPRTPSAQLLWAAATGEIFPAELARRQRRRGPAVRATGAHGRELPALTVSIAHRGEVGVAIARRGPRAASTSRRSPTRPESHGRDAALRRGRAGAAGRADRRPGACGSPGSGRPRKPWRSCSAPACAAARGLRRSSRRPRTS